MQKNKFTLDQTSVKVLQAIKGAMAVMATDSENHFKRNFREQGFVDESVEKWQPRKRESRADKNARLRAKRSGKGYGTNRGILIQSGALRRSIVRSRINAYMYKVTSDLPYSSIHNYGLNGRAWGRHNFKMPQRRFIGVSRRLMRQNIETLKRFINKSFE